MSILTPDEYRALTGLSETQAPDARFGPLCEAAAAAVENYCNRAFDQAAVTEYHAGNGTRVIALRRRPVQSITSIYYDPGAYYGTAAGGFDATTLYTEGVDFARDPQDTGLVVRLRGVWPELPRRLDQDKLAKERTPGFGEIKVTYVGGYGTVPAPVKLACAQITTLSALLVKQGAMLGKERLGDWSYEVLVPFVQGSPDLGTARQLLSKYRELPW